MTNEVVVKKEDAVANFVDGLSTGWAKVLPKVCTPERFARVAVSCIKKNDKLRLALSSTDGRRSLAEAFMKCAELGIEPDGRRAHLIPYGKEITLVFDYKGIVELAMRSGIVSSIHSDKVCENDEFEYNVGEILKHKIDFKKPRGEAYAYYTIVNFKDGGKKTEVMGKWEIDEIKERSPAWGGFVKYGKKCPWNTDYDEMAKKTVFKRASKWLPLSPEAKQAIDMDNDEYADGIHQYKNPLSEMTPEERYAPAEEGNIIDAESAVIAPEQQTENKSETVVE